MDVEVKVGKWPRRVTAACQQHRGRGVRQSRGECGWQVRASFSAQFETWFAQECPLDSETPGLIQMLVQTSGKLFLFGFGSEEASSSSVLVLASCVARATWSRSVRQRCFQDIDAIFASGFTRSRHSSASVFMDEESSKLSG